MSGFPPRLAVTLGDPGGVGPEVARKALLEAPAEIAARVVAIGDESFRKGFSNFLAVKAGGGRDVAGTVTGESVRRAVDLALSGEVDGIVTGPAHKPALLRAGFPPGHTEMLKEWARASEVGMLMCDEGWGRSREGRRSRPPRRVLLATIHIPLSKAAQSVTAPLLVSQCALTYASLKRDWGIEQPRVALCALNPHASDEGLFGTEEREVYAPAISELATKGILVEGPLPADTVFARAFRGEFDVVVAPYHDVGMAAFKTASFGRGVNVTIGLPFVRTSPDHGTAFDIAGRDMADASSMREAILLAFELSVRRRKSAKRS